MRTATPTARDQVAPALHKAQEALTDTVLPAVRTGLLAAREKGGELLTSDTAHEARRRGSAMLRIARGEPVVMVPPRRRIGFVLTLLGIGAGIGVGLSWLARRMAAPAMWETYERMDAVSPVPSGTDGGTMTQTEDIDLRAGAPRL